MLEALLENKSGNYFSEEIFQPPEKNSFRVGSAAFEIQLNHGVWGLPFKCPLTVCNKTVSSLLRERT